MERWGTRLGVILAVMGSAVGLGNFLRFPGKAAQYEGGAFMVPYFVALLVLGIPLAWAEWAMGRFGGCKGYNSTPGIYRTLWRKNPLAPYCGVLGLLVPVVIYMYYVFIEGWCLAYAWYMLTGQLTLGKDAAEYGKFFDNFIGSGSNGLLVAQHGTLAPAVIFLLICFVLNFALIFRGISKGIEKFCLIAMPMLVVCAIIVLIRVLTLGTPDPSRPDLNVLNGLGYLWNAHTTNKTFLESLANGQMWLEATGQIFFSLSVGFGVIITYSSYLRRDDDIALSSLTSCAGNEFCEVALGGMITVPAAFVFLGAAGIAGKGTFGLGFVTLPMVFEMMPLGRFVGFLFFFLLFLAAVTSSLSMLQPAIALLEEGLGIGRKASVALLGFITLIGSLFVVYFSKGLIALDTMDFWVGTVGIFILAFFQVILFGWVMGLRTGVEEINRGGTIRVPYFVGLVLKFVAPLYLGGVLVTFLYQSFTAKEGNYFLTLRDSRDAQLTVAFIVIVAILFLLLIGQSVKRWQKRELMAEESP
ncbi:MAG: sodium:calcium symporter [Phycisphaera sp.]|nr:sodium:calcium symporter [Phycisphaera sp.]